MADLGQTLCVWPHFDDGPFNGADTLTEAVRDGSEITSVIISDSAGGGASGRIRESEERASCKLIGIEDIRLLGYPDGKIHLERYRTEIVRKLAEIIAELKPDTIFTYDEDGGLTGHSDHIVTGRYVKEALKLAGRSCLVLTVAITEEWLTNVMPPLRDQAHAIWNDEELHATPDHELYIDNRLSGEALEAKLQAVWAHESQIRPLIRKLASAGGEELLTRHWFAREAFRATIFPSPRTESE